MANRIITDTILWDERVQALSPEAFSIYIRLIVLADDYGIGPASPAELTAALGLSPAMQKVLSRNFPEIPGNDLVRISKFKSKVVYVIKPDSWDRIQWNLVRKRTKSKHLGECAETVEVFRREVWENPNGSLKNDSRNFPEFPGISRLARANSSSSEENTTVESCTEEPEQKELVTMCSNQKQPATRIAQILTTLHRIQGRTGIDPVLFPVSEIGWTADLHAAGQKYGYECVAREAERFEIWFVEKCEHEPGEKRRKHRPKARFLGTWMGQVKPANFTTGDTNEIATPAASQFANLVRSDAA